MKRYTVLLIVVAVLSGCSEGSGPTSPTPVPSNIDIGTQIEQQLEAAQDRKDRGEEPICQGPGCASSGEPLISLSQS